MNLSKDIQGISDLEKYLISKNTKNLVLVTGGKSYEGCGAKGLFESLSSECYENLMIIQHEGANPYLENIEKHFEPLADFNPDLILAIGGGGPMDTAKIISAGFKN